MVSWVSNPYSIVLIVIGMALGAGLLPFAWRRRRRPGGVSFVVLTLSTLGWTLLYGVELGFTTLAPKVLLTSIEYIFIAATPAMYVLFIQQYTGHGRWASRSKVMILFLIPLITVLMVWTNRYHGLMQQNITLDLTGPFPAIAKNYGPWFWVYYAFALCMLFRGTILLVRRMYGSGNVHRGQSVSLAVAAAAPWTVNLLHVARIYPIHRLDLTPVAFGISVAAMAIGFFRYHLFDLVPLARDVAMQEIGDGLIVIDQSHLVIDANGSAARLLDRPPSTLVGQSLFDLFPEIGISEEGQEWSIHRSSDMTAIDVRMWPLIDRRGDKIGHALILRDITATKKAERALLASHERSLRLHGAALRLAAAAEESDIIDITLHVCSEELDRTRVSWYTATPNGLVSHEESSEGGLVATLDPDTPASFRDEDLGEEWAFGEWIPAPEVGGLLILARDDRAFLDEDRLWVELLLQHVHEAIKRVRLQRRLAEQARRDPLTGVYNRRHLVEAMDAEASRADRWESGVTFVMLDINGFKEVNDQYGHAVGDRILMDFGRILSEAVRAYDLVIRYGGDEFLLVLPDTDDCRAARTIAGRIRDAVKAWNRNDSPIPTVVSIALGTSYWVPYGTPWEAAIAAADDDMYCDKRSFDRSPVSIEEGGQDDSI